MRDLSFGTLKKSKYHSWLRGFFFLCAGGSGQAAFCMVAGMRQQEFYFFENFLPLNLFPQLNQIISEKIKFHNISFWLAKHKHTNIPTMM